jgi:hypothetical protein
MARSYASERRGDKGEEREGSLDEGGVRDVMSPKEERREGSGTGTRVRIKSGPEAKKRRNAQCTRMVSSRHHKLLTRQLLPTYTQ